MKTGDRKIVKKNARHLILTIVALCALASLALVQSACEFNNLPHPLHDLRIWVSFDIYGGHGQTPERQQVSRGGRVTLPIDVPTDGGFANTGYVFGGWSRYAGDGYVYVSNTVFPPRGRGIEASLTLYAVWVNPSDEYSQKDFNSNFSGIYDIARAPRSRGIVLPLPLYADNRDGYALVGWDRNRHLNARYTAPAFELGEEYSIPQTVMADLYAIWLPIYWVYFHANFPANFTSDGQPPDPQGTIHGRDFALPYPGNLSVRNHSFAGWSLNRNADPDNPAGAAIKQPGDTHTVYVRYTNFYAIWRYHGIYIDGNSRAQRGTSVDLSVRLVNVDPANIVWSYSSNFVGLSHILPTTGGGATLNIGPGEGGIGYNHDFHSEGILIVRATCTVTGAYSEHQITIHGERRPGDFRVIRSVHYHTMAISWDGALYAWGQNTFYPGAPWYAGRLGLGWRRGPHAYTPTRVPTEINPVRRYDNDWIEVSVGQTHTLGIRREGRPEGQGGTLWAWGDNGNLQLGISHRYYPGRVGGHNDWIYVAAGQSYSIGMRLGGFLYSWGHSSQGRLGRPGVGIARINAPNNPTFRSVSAGQLHALAIDTDGRLWGWGRNLEGQVGTGSTSAQVSTPVQIIHPQGRTWASASAGHNFSVALDSDGNAWRWGTGAGGGFSAPTRITAPAKPWSAIGTAYEHAMLIDRDGNLYVWGHNTLGRVTGVQGAVNIFPPQRFNPANAPDLVGQRWLSFAGGVNHSLAIRTDGQLWSWGANTPVGVRGTGNASGFSAPSRIVIP